MGEHHVEELFSAAYDDELTAAERERYDAHLAGCDRCAAAAAEFRAAIDAVRALPQARMPVRVVLPATPPVAERRSVLPKLRLPRPGPAWGGAALGLAGIAAVVVAVHAHGGGTGGAGGASTALSLHGNAYVGAAPGALSAGGAGTGAQSAASCAQPVVAVTALAKSASLSPAGFSNRVAVTNERRPGQELVLATTSSHYAPGAQVLVFAALTTTASPQGSAVVPCVSLVNTVAAPAAAPNSGTSGSGGGSAAQSPGPAYGVDSGALSGVGSPPLAIAVPTSQSVAGTLPVQVLTIPANLPRGTVLHLLALIPAGVPGGASDQPAVEAVLTVVVS